MRQVGPPCEDTQQLVMFNCRTLLLSQTGSKKHQTKIHININKLWAHHTCSQCIHNESLNKFVIIALRCDTHSIFPRYDCSDGKGLWPSEQRLSTHATWWIAKSFWLQQITFLGYQLSCNSDMFSISACHRGRITDVWFQHYSDQYLNYIESKM